MSNTDDNYQSKILDELKKPSIKSFNAIRQLIANAETDDFESMYVFLYDKLSEYANGNEGIIICHLEEYMYHATFRIDKEINIMACIAKILETISTKKII
jgi:hypothetical protein